MRVLWAPSNRGEAAVVSFLQGAATTSTNYPTLSCGQMSTDGRRCNPNARRCGGLGDGAVTAATRGSCVDQWTR